MERPAARDDSSQADGTRGTGTLAVRRGRNSRDSHAPLPRVNSNTSNTSNTTTTTNSGRTAIDRAAMSNSSRRDSRERGNNDIGGGNGGGGGHYASETRGGRPEEDHRGGNVGGGGGGLRFEGPARAGTQRGSVSGSGGAGGSGGGGGGGSGGRSARGSESIRGAGMSRGSKRGRSEDSDRGGGGGDMGFERGGGGGGFEGDPSEAFDSKRMRHPDHQGMMMEHDVGPLRPPGDGWGRGYIGGGGGGGGGDVRYRDEAGGRHGVSAGAGRMQMPSRDAHMDHRPPYDAQWGRSGPPAMAIDGLGGGVRGGMEKSSHREGHGRDQQQPVDDSRAMREGKKPRGDRQRSSNSNTRDEEGGGRKEKKKSGKSKKKKR